MFWEIFRFELKYRIKRPATWAYFGILFAFGALIAMDGGNGNGSEKAFANSSFQIAIFMGIMSIFMTMISSAVMGVPVYRDIEHGVKDYYFSYPVNEKGYLLGRFCGSFLILMLISLGLHLGMIVGYSLGPLVGWEEAERFGPLNLWHYIQPTFTLLWPNLLFTGTIFFCLVALTRKVFISYVGSVLFFIGYLLAINLTQDVANQDLADILDPFAFNTYSNATKYWTPVEQNVLTQPLTGNFLINRLLWIGASLLLLVFTLFRFDFVRFLDKRLGKKKKGEVAEVEDKSGVSWSLPRVMPTFSNGLYFRQMLQQAWLEFRSILKDVYFIGMILGGVLFLFLDGWLGNTIYGTPNLPMTYFMIESKNATYIIFVFIIIIFYTGEVVHRDKSVGFDQIVDALPTPNWMSYGSKFLAMAMVAFFLASMVWVVGVFSQTVQGYFNYEFGKYFTDLYLLEFPRYLQLVILAFFVHILVNKKFLGHVIAISVWLVLFGINQIAEVDFNMWLYSYRPGYLISDMNGFGHFIKPVSWFNLYWLALGGVLLIIGNLLWNRGTEENWRTRLKLMRSRWNSRAAIGVFALLAIWVSSGAFIYHNVKNLNSYQQSDYQENLSVEYEQKYSRYAKVLQPKIIDVNVKADIFASERRVELEGDFTIINRTGADIDSIFLNFNAPKSQSDLIAFTIDGTAPQPIHADNDQRFYIYRLAKPMKPTDTLSMKMKVVGGYKGFPNSGFGQSIVYNGTFFNSNAFPSFGYSSGKELTSDLDRKKHELEPKDYFSPEQTDTFGLSNFLFEDDADYIMFEATLSTDPGQIAIAPGYLQREWEENGRQYYHYKMDKEMLNFYNFCSADYEVARDVWKGPDGTEVDIEIFHHDKHNYNIDRFIRAVQASFDYFHVNFSPYQFRQMRILEFPRYATFAQSFPNTVPYAESFGWVGDFSDPDDSDYSFFVTAHEVAHQWWAHQITPSNTRGANQLSETMAEYAALMVMKKEYGEESMQKFLKYELDRYLRGRTTESKFEKTLLDNDNQAYVWYRKGANIMYALQDYVTEDSLNRAFSDFLADAAFRPEPPFANSLEWYDYIDSATPDSLKYFIEESFKNITLYENRMREVKYEALDNGKYKVKLTFDSQKIQYDGNGNETARPERANLIDIGIFGEDGKNERGMTKLQPIYLQKHWIKPGQQELEFIVDEEPVKAGIDPYNKLIDRISDDNLIPADEG